MPMVTFPSCRGIDFHDTTVGLAKKLAMCTRDSGGVNQVGPATWVHAMRVLVDLSHKEPARAALETCGFSHHLSDDHKTQFAIAICNCSLVVLVVLLIPFMEHEQSWNQWRAIFEYSCYISTDLCS